MRIVRLFFAILAGILTICSLNFSMASNNATQKNYESPVPLISIFHKTIENGQKLHKNATSERNPSFLAEIDKEHDEKLRLDQNPLQNSDYRLFAERLKKSDPFGKSAHNADNFLNLRTSPSYSNRAKRNTNVISYKNKESIQNDYFLTKKSRGRLE